MKRAWWVIAVMLVARVATAQTLTYGAADAARDSHAINDQYFSKFMAKTNTLDKPGWLHSEFLLSNPSNDPFVFAVDFAMNMPLFEVDLPFFGNLAAGWLIGSQLFILPRESPADVAARAGYALQGYLGDASNDQNGMVGFTGFDLYGEDGTYIRFGLSASVEFEAVTTSTRPYLFSNFWLLENVSSFLDLGFDFGGKDTVSRFGSGLGYRFQGLVPHLSALDFLAPEPSEDAPAPQANADGTLDAAALQEQSHGSDIEASFSYNAYRRLLANQHLMSVILRWYPFPDRDLKLSTLEDMFSIQLGRYFPVYDNQDFGDGFGNAEWFFRTDLRFGKSIKAVFGLSHIPGVDWGWRIGAAGQYFAVAVQNDFMMDSNYTQPLPNTSFYIMLSYPIFHN